MIENRYPEVKRNIAKSLLVCALASVATSEASSASNSMTSNLGLHGQTVELRRGTTLTKYGGILLDSQEAAGVDCGQDSHINGFGLTVRMRANAYYDTPQLDSAREYRRSNTPTIFAGLNSPFAWDGYYPLKSGWAVQYHEGASEPYDLYHFDVVPSGTEKTEKIDAEGNPVFHAVTKGSMRAQKIGSYSLVGLELGAAGDFTDDQTTLTLGAYRKFGEFEPHIWMGIKCTEDIPSRIIDTE